jgi:uncharacterized protein (DUF885 family)
MYTDTHTGEFMRSLARAISDGQTVPGWARSKDVCSQDAQAWAELPEFRDLVEKYRIEHAEHMVGKIGSRVDRAIDRLVELSENIDKPSVGVVATKAVIEKWIALTEHFVQEQKYQELMARCNVVLEKRGVSTKHPFRQVWRPHAGVTS